MDTTYSRQNKDLFGNLCMLIRNSVGGW